VETTRFGAIAYEPGDVITFTQPILGFNAYRRFLMLPGPSPFLHWLQSTEAGELAFILMDPCSVVPDYSASVSKHDLAELAADDVSELEVHTIVVVPPDPSKIRTNLKAPVLLHRAQRLGKQVVLDRSDYPVQFHLAQVAPASGG
jgi:flagellar assembly factor FliW